MTCKAELHENTVSIENFGLSEQPVLDTLPRMGLPKESSKEERLAKIFGIRTSQLGQLIKQIKDSQPRVFRSVMKEVRQLGIRRDMPKNELETAVATRIFSYVDYRRDLLRKHFEQEIANDSQKNRPPVLEYELIKAWNSKFDFTGAPVNNSLKGVKGDSMEEKLSLKITHTAHYFESMPPILNRRFRTIADEVLAGLAYWSEKTEEEKQLLAGAAFAVASAADSVPLYLVFTSLIPELAAHLHLEDFTWSVSESEAGFVKKHQRQVALRVVRSINQLEEFSRTGDLKLLNEVSASLDLCEKETLELGEFEIEKIRELMAETIKKLGLVKDFLDAAGLAFDTSSIEDRVEHWDEIMQLEVMKKPSHARHLLAKSVGDEANSVHIGVSITQNNLEKIAEERERVLQEAHDTWARQLELLQETVEKTKEAKQKFKAMCDEVGKLDPIQTPKTEETQEVSQEPELCLKSEIKALQDAHAQALKDVKLRLEQTTEHNNELRKEVAEARQQTEAMILSLGDQKDSPAAITDEVMGVIDTLAVKATPVEILELLQALHPNRVEILESAYSSAREDQASIPATSLYQRLTALLTGGLDIIRDTGQIIDCKDVVPGEVSAKESDTVRGNPRLRNMRHFSYKGSKQAFYPHLRLNSVCRVYFDYMPEERRIVIAYVGRHLPT